MNLLSGEASQRFALSRRDVWAGLGWEQEKLEATLREMLDAQRAARAKRSPTRQAHALLAR